MVMSEQLREAWWKRLRCRGTLEGVRIFCSWACSSMVGDTR